MDAGAMILLGLGGLLIVLLCWGSVLIKTDLFQQMVLRSEQKKQEGYGVQPLAKNLIGQTALAETDLRPAGKINLIDLKLDAVSDGEFILKGSQVQIMKQEQGYVIVKLII